MSREKMAKELELGADIVKAVFSCVLPYIIMVSIIADLSCAISELPSYDMVIPALLDKGIHHLKETCFLTPGSFSPACLITSLLHTEFIVT